MSLQEAKDHVARENQFKDWNDWINQSVEVVGMPHIPFAFHDRAAQIYGDSQYNQALDNAINLFTPLERLNGPATSIVIEELKKLKR